MIEPQTIIVPINEKNRQGIDDILETVREMLDPEMKICEAYVVISANAGALTMARALQEKSGQIVKAPKPKKTWTKKTPKPEVEQPV
jgi:hypothetical protein